MDRIVNRIITRGVPIVLVIALLVLAFPIGVGAQGMGIGVSPGVIDIEDALHGEEYRERIDIHYTGEEDTALDLTVTGEIDGWVSFYEPGTDIPIESITASAVEWTRISVKIAIPDDAPVGITSGTIFATTASTKVETGMGVKLQAQTKVSINVVGTPILGGVVSDLNARDVETGFPVRVTFNFENTGNVVATPQVKVEIVQDGTTLGSFEIADARIGRGMTQTVSAGGDFIAGEPGDYTARVTVSLGDEVLATEELPFTILPEGTLTRSGVFTALKLDVKPELGVLSKVMAGFANTGERDTNAQFVAEAYRDGKLIRTLRSEEILVPVGETHTLVSYLEVDSPGEYRIEGYINYEGKTTDSKDLSFEILPEEDEATPTSEAGPEENEEGGGVGAFLWIIIVVVVILAAGGAFFYMRRGKPSEPES